VKKQEHEATVLKNRLERLQDVQMPKKLPKFRMRFDLTDPPRNKIVISCGDLNFAYGGNMIFSHAMLEIPGGKTVAITGKNGAGKTTLLQMLHHRDPQITFAPKLKLGYLSQGLDNAEDHKTVLENTMAVSIQDKAAVYSILSGLLFTGEDVAKNAGVLSGGERIRLALAMLIASDCNGLMLDEPTNYLDIRSVEAVETMVRDYPGTVLVVSHDARFVANTAELELRVDGGKIERIERLSGQALQRETPGSTDRLVADMRLAQLTSAISTAPPAEKEALEREYAMVLKQLHAGIKRV
jgi:macrolide transport system ATP-binding/permease protein